MRRRSARADRASGISAMPSDKLPTASICGSAAHLAASAHGSRSRRAKSEKTVSIDPLILAPSNRATGTRQDPSFSARTHQDMSLASVPSACRWLGPSHRTPVPSRSSSQWPASMNVCKWSVDSIWLATFRRTGSETTQAAPPSGSVSPRRVRGRQIDCRCIKRGFRPAPRRSRQHPAAMRIGRFRSYGTAPGRLILLRRPHEGANRGTGLVCSRPRRGIDEPTARCSPVLA